MSGPDEPSVRIGAAVTEPITADAVSATSLSALRDAALSTTPTSLGPRRTSSPHEFYRYPARFSPEFARATITAFTNPGELVLDPFVGGGTTVVEARMLGRPVVGADVNPLATFVTSVKSRSYGPQALAAVECWRRSLPQLLNAHAPAEWPAHWEAEGYFRNFDGPDTWRLRKLIAQALTAANALPAAEQEFARCIVLRTAQWALDAREHLPSVDAFRQTLLATAEAMIETARVASRAYRDARQEHPTSLPAATVLTDSVPGLSQNSRLANYPQPRLIVTSPPYPGVYVMYHRWKVRGRKETPAPYWIADRRDGRGIAYYTMSARAEPTLNSYYSQLLAAYRDIARLCGPRTWLVQIVGFSDPDVQLRRYLRTMEQAGFVEVVFPQVANENDDRLWRPVPGRRWWARAGDRLQVAPHTSREVVLFHRLRESANLL